MPRLSCGMQCVLAALFALNILFLFIGFSVMGVGIYIKSSGSFSAVAEIYSISESLGSEAMQWIGIGMIVAGILTVGLATFGCLGASLQNRWYLYLYSLFLFLIITFEIAAVIVILVFRNNLWTNYDSGFMEIFHHAYSQNQTDNIKIIENLEREFQCCGVNGDSDYVKYGYKIPLACYSQQSKDHSLYQQGCAQAVVIWIWNELPIIAGVLGAMLFIEIFGVISSVVLGVALSHSSSRAEYDEIL